jgi:hypothetical protein
MLLLLLLPMSLAAARPAQARDEACAVKAFAGYSYLPAGGSDFPRRNSHGFQAAISRNFGRSFAIVGDFGGQYSNGLDGTDIAVYQYMAGPRLTGPAGPDGGTQVFVHGLVGGATGVGGFAGSGFAAGGGGGVDLGAGDRFAVRVQADWLMSMADMMEGGLRIGLGLVFRVDEP